jgi:hypothetical protein
MNNEDVAIIEAGVEIVLMMVAARVLFAWDERRMTEEQRERAWPPASRGVVVCSPLWFSPLWLVGVPLHFLRTRRNLRGLAEAIGWTVVMFGLLMAIGSVFQAFAGGAGIPD